MPTRATIRAVSRARVVVLGAGFGGLECAKALDGGPLDVLLVDRNNYHLFTPLLYQVASSLLNPSDIAFPVRRVFRGSPNVRFRQTEVAALELDDKRVRTASGETIDYDYLVVAAGSTTNFFGNRLIERRSYGLKNLSEALQLRNHILGCLEQASLAAQGEQACWMTFVIVGGGPTGVEYAGALAELMRLVLPSEYPTILVPARIVVVEGQGRLLGGFSEKLGGYTARRLAELGVEVVLGKLVKSLDDDGATLSDGTILATRTLVWSAGVQPESVAAALPHTSRSSRIDVDDHLRIVGRADAFAIGDVAAVRQDGAELPMVSAPAMQQGRYVAALIAEHLGSGGASVSERAAPFRYVDKGSMATIGRNAAVCAMGGIELTGFLGWLGWLVVHIYYLIGFRNRLVVLWSWCWNYVWYDRPVRIITRAKGELARTED